MDVKSFKHRLRILFSPLNIFCIIIKNQLDIFFNKIRDTFLIYFSLCWVFLVAWAFSSCSEQWGLLSGCGVQASHCGSFSRCRA